MGVGTSEHFDRYVQVGVPESDLAEATVRTAAEELRAGDQGPATTELVRRMRGDASPALRKLLREHRASPLPASTTLPLLASIYLAAMDQKSGLFGLSPDFSIIALAVDVLDQTEAAAAADLVEALARSDRASLALAADIVRMGLKESDTPHPWASHAKAPVGDALTAGIKSFASRPARTHPRLLSFLYAHLDLAEPPNTREVVWEAIDSGAWDLKEVLGLLIPLGQASNGEDSWTSMGDFSEGTIEDLLGVDLVLDRLPEHPELLDRHDSIHYFDRRVEADDLEARIEYAMTGLERVRARRRQEAEATEGGQAPATAGDSEQEWGD